MSEKRGDGDLPPDLPPAYADAYRRGYESAYADSQRPEGQRPEGQREDAGQEDAGQEDAGREHPGQEDAGRGEPGREEAGQEEPGREAQRQRQGEGRPSEQQGRPDESAHNHGQRAPAWAPDDPSGEGADEPGASTGPAPQVDDRGDPEPTRALGRHALLPGMVLDDPLPERPTDRRDRGDPRRWLAPVVLVGLALLLVLGAYLIGRAFSGSVEESPAQPKPTGVALGDGADSASGSASGSSGKHSSGAHPSKGAHPSRGAHPFQGPISPVALHRAHASCRSAPGVDAAGNRVTYPARNVTDGKPSTAWRCDGKAIGQTLTLRLPGRTTVVRLGLIPGYAKVDPANGADRYPQNNRITKVRWTFPGGGSVVQSFDPTPSNRSLQAMTIPAHRARRVTLHVLAVAGGPRDTTAISTAYVGQPR